MSKNYAKGLTKDDLIKMGIKDIYFNPYDLQYHVIGNKGKEKSLVRNNKGYLRFNVYILDEQGQYIKVPIKRKRKGYKKISDNYIYKQAIITLHRAIYAWFKGDVPEGMVVDHIDNKHETHYDNRPENLQLLTPAENISKERNNCSKWKFKCDLSKPLEYYENRLNSLLETYNEEKDENSSCTKKAHKLRVQIYQYRAKIRYWKAYHEECTHTIKAEQLALSERKKRASDLKELRKTIREAHEAYTKNKTSENRYVWKLSIENLKKYLELHPFKKLENIETELFSETSSDNLLQY